jgi:hypothetical protein
MPTPEPENFHQLALRFIDPIQHGYEAIRDVVLFAETITQRTANTRFDRSTVGAKELRFVEGGMLGLADMARRTPYPFPERVVGYLLYARPLYPPGRLWPHEM